MAEDQRLPDDTLFFIIEEDFRWYPEGEDPTGVDGYQARAAETKRKRDAMSKSLPPRHDTIALELPMPGQTSQEPTAWGKGKGKKKPTRVQTQYHQALPRGNSVMSHIDEGFHQNVVDLVRTATFAHRNGMGEIVWTSWVPQNKKDDPGKKKWGGRTRMSNGSTCILMTKLGFAQFNAAVQAQQVYRTHIDLTLIDWLKKSAKRVGACYLYPSSGSYTEHASGCDPTNFGEAQGGRKSGFDTDGPAWGTRVSSDPEKREKWLKQWVEKGHETWLSLPPDHVLHTKKYRWQSYGIPEEEDEDDETEKAGRWRTDQEPATKRARRQKRTVMHQDYKFRYWVETPEQAVHDVAP
jgi:hypothetical protein